MHWTVASRINKLIQQQSAWNPSRHPLTVNHKTKPPVEEKQHWIIQV